jgi:hypothetical protein
MVQPLLAAAQLINVHLRLRSPPRAESAPLDAPLWASLLCLCACSPAFWCCFASPRWSLMGGRAGAPIHASGVAVWHGSFGGCMLCCATCAWWCGGDPEAVLRRCYPPSARCDLRGLPTSGYWASSVPCSGCGLAPLGCPGEARACLSPALVGGLVGGHSGVPGSPVAKRVQCCRRLAALVLPCIGLVPKHSQSQAQGRLSRGMSQDLGGACVSRG